MLSKNKAPIVTVKWKQLADHRDVTPLVNYYVSWECLTNVTVMSHVIEHGSIPLKTSCACVGASTAPGSGAHVRDAVWRGTWSFCEQYIKTINKRGGVLRLAEDDVECEYCSYAIQ